MLRRAHRVGRAAVLAVAVLAVSLLAGVAVAFANTVTMTSCLPGQAVPQPPWTSTSSAPTALTPADNCAGGGRLKLALPAAGRVVPLHTYEQWYTVVPAAMSLRSFSFPATAALVSSALTNHPGGGSSGFDARFLSAAGSVTFIDDNQPGGGGMDYARAGTWPIGGRYFILDVNCSRSVEAGAGGCARGQQDSADLLDIKDFTLVAEDDQPPALNAPASAPAGGANLWSASPWVRGPFSLAFTASNATGSGVCVAAASLAGRPLPPPPGALSTPNTSVWQQCPASYSYQEAVDTTGYPNGLANLDLYAADAASPNNTTPASKTIGIDNQPVTLSLTGPSAVIASAASASAQLTASASAGPSGADIFCSVDGGPEVEYLGASAQVPVTGLGPHQASCYAQNHSVDANGTPARSATQPISLSIRQPTAQAVTFARIAGALRCHRVTVTVKVRAKTRVIRRHHTTILVRGRTRTITQRVQRCHAQTVKRKVWVVLQHHGKVVKRHGKPVRVRRAKRVVVLPHPVTSATRRIGHGKATTVSGYLGVSDNTPLAGAPVAVIAAPDNGLQQFTLPIADTTTTASGTWTVTVPPGPSRLIEAVYAGGVTTAPSVSTQVKLIVPAKVRLLKVTPRRVPWGATVQLVGELDGGFLPPGGALVRLRIGEGQHQTTYGVETHVTGNGRFITTYTFGAGDPAVHQRFWFEIASLPSGGSYPFAPARSGRRYVVVGGHGVVRRARHHHKKRHHKRKVTKRPHHRKHKATKHHHKAKRHHRKS